MRNQIEAMKKENAILKDKNRKMKSSSKNKQSILNKLDAKIDLFEQ